MDAAPFIFALTFQIDDDHGAWHTTQAMRRLYNSFILTLLVNDVSSLMEEFIATVKEEVRHEVALLLGTNWRRHIDILSPERLHYRCISGRCT